MGRSASSKKTVLIGALVAVPVMIPFGGILAEEGLRATLSVGQRLESVNEDGFTTPRDDGVRSLTTLDFGLTSQTSNQQIDLRVDTGLSYNFSDNEGADQTEFEDPTVRLSYGIENRDSALSFAATYRRTDVDRANFFDDLIDDEIETDEGTRTNINARTSLILGRTAPVTYELNHAYGRSSFSGTTDNESDSTTQSLDGRVTFRLSPVASANVFASWRDVDRDDPDATDRTTRRAGIGGSYDLSRVLRATAQLSYSENDSTGSQGNDGLGYSLGLTRTMPNGTLGATFSADETINGTRRQANISRALDIRRGSISASLGVTKTDGLSAAPLASLGVSYALSQTSDVTVNLSQSSAISNDDEETVRTRLSANYTQDLGALSSLSAGLQLASQNVLDDAGTDRSSFSVNLTYRYDVGNDWDLLSGVRYSSSRRDDRDDRDTSTIFVGLEKTFDFRP